MLVRIGSKAPRINAPTTVPRRLPVPPSTTTETIRIERSRLKFTGVIAPCEKANSAPIPPAIPAVIPKVNSSGRADFFPRLGSTVSCSRSVFRSRPNGDSPKPQQIRITITVTRSISSANLMVLSAFRVAKERPPIFIEGIPATPNGPPVTTSQTFMICCPPSWKARVNRIKYSPLIRRTAGKEIINAAIKVTTIAAMIAAHQGQPNPYPTPDTLMS